MLQRRVGLALLSGVTVAVAAFPFARLQLDQHHDGYMFKAALDVARGDMLYRDTFMQYLPIPTWINAISVMLLGEHVLSIRLATVVAYGVIGALFFLVWRRLVPDAWALLGVALWFAYADFFRDDRPMYPWSSVHLLVFHALAMYCVIRGVEEKGKGESTRWWHAAAGAAAAASMLCRLTTGMAILVGLLVLAVIDRDRKRRLRPTVTGFGFVVLVFVGWAFATGVADDIWDQTIAWPYRWSDAVSSSDFLELILSQSVHGVALGCVVVGVVRLLAFRARPAAGTAVNALTGVAVGAVVVSRWDATVQLWDASVLIAVVGLVALWRAFRTRSVTPFAAAAVLAAGGLVQVYPAHDVSHLWWSTAAGMGILLAAGRRLAPRLRLRSPAAFALALSVVVAAPLVSQAVGKVRGDWVELGDASGITDGMYLRPEAAESTTTLLRALDRIDDDRPILHVGRNAIWASYSKAEDFGPQKVDWGPGRPFGAPELRYLREHRPVVVTTHSTVSALLENELGYVRLAQVAFEEWGRFEYLLLVPKEEALAPEPAGLRLPVPQSWG